MWLLRVIEKVLEKSKRVFISENANARIEGRDSALEQAFECARETFSDSVIILLCKFLNYVFLMFNYLNGINIYLHFYDFLS